MGSDKGFLEKRPPFVCSTSISLRCQVCCRHEPPLFIMGIKKYNHIQKIINFALVFYKKVLSKENRKKTCKTFK